MGIGCETFGTNCDVGCCVNKTNDYAIRDLVFHPGISDPLVFQNETQDDWFLEIYAEKDENGKIIQITTARTFDSLSGTKAVVRYDHQFCPSHISSLTGDFRDFAWHSNKRITMEYLSTKNTSVNESIHILGAIDPLDEPSTVGGLYEPITKPHLKDKPRQKHLRTHESNTMTNLRRSRNLNANTCGTYTVDVMKCSKPFRPIGFTDGYTLIIESYWPNGDVTDAAYYFIEQFDGQYVSTFPTTKEAIDQSTAKKACTDAAELIYFMCSGLQDSLVDASTACFTIMMALNPAAEVVGLVCEGLLTSAWFMCKRGVLGLPGDPTLPTVPGTTLSQELCDLIESTPEMNATKTVACVKPSLGDFCIPNSIVTAISPNFDASYAMEIKDEPTVFSVNVIPQDPEPWSDFLVSVDFGCVTDYFKIHWTSTDGRGDESTCHTTTPCIALIEGGDGGVVYTIVFSYKMDGFFSSEQIYQTFYVVTTIKTQSLYTLQLDCFHEESGYEDTTTIKVCADFTTDINTRKNCWEAPPCKDVLCYFKCPQFNVITPDSEALHYISITAFGTDGLLVDSWSLYKKGKFVRSWWSNNRGAVCLSDQYDYPCWPNITNAGMAVSGVRLYMSLEIARQNVPDLDTDWGYIFV